MVVDREPQLEHPAWYSYCALTCSSLAISNRLTKGQIFGCTITGADLMTSKASQKSNRCLPYISSLMIRRHGWCENGSSDHQAKKSYLWNCRCSISSRREVSTLFSYSKKKQWCKPNYAATLFSILLCKVGWSHQMAELTAFVAL